MSAIQDEATTASLAALTDPMEIAGAFVAQTRMKRELDAALGRAKKHVELLAGKMLDIWEQGLLPASFRHEDASVFSRQELWASAKDGDHAALSGVLAEMGLVEYLPKTVNAQSISAYVREHINPETDEVEGLDPRLEAVLKISRPVKAVANFG